MLSFPWPYSYFLSQNWMRDTSCASAGTIQAAQTNMLRNLWTKTTFFLSIFSGLLIVFLRNNSRLLLACHRWRVSSSAHLLQVSRTGRSSFSPSCSPQLSGWSECWNVYQWQNSRPSRASTPIRCSKAILPDAPLFGLSDRNVHGHIRRIRYSVHSSTCTCLR